MIGEGGTTCRVAGDPKGGRSSDVDEQVSLRGDFSHRFIMHLTSVLRAEPPVVKESRGKVNG